MHAKVFKKQGSMVSATQSERFRFTDTYCFIIYAYIKRKEGRKRESVSEQFWQNINCLMWPKDVRDFFW